MAEQKAQFVTEMKAVTVDAPEGVKEESMFNIRESGSKTLPNNLFTVAHGGGFCCSIHEVSSKREYNGRSRNIAFR
jgi:organic hydroperoxide reductase OsmC/OhrA